MKNVTIPSQFLQELLALCGPEDHELRERVLKSAAPTHPAEGVPEDGFELWWADHMPKSTQTEAWSAWAALHQSAQQGLDARTVYEAECFRWLRDEALKVWRAGPVVFMTDADGCPGDGGAWSGNILTGNKLESAIPVATQAKQGGAA